MGSEQKKALLEEAAKIIEELAQDAIACCHPDLMIDDDLLDRAHRLVMKINKENENAQH